MKILIFLSFLLFSVGVSFSQEWRDSLTVARNAYKNKEYDKAFKYYQSAQSKAPEGIDLSEEMGQSAYKSHQYEKAEKIYQQTASDQSNTKKRAADYHNLGNAKMRQKNYQGAIESYKEALRNNPKDEQTRYNLSEAMRQLSDENKKKQQNGEGDNKNQKENNQNGEGDKQQDGKDGKDGNEGNQQGDSKDGQQGQPGGDSQRSGAGPKLKDKAVEKKLDELMKQEAATKRKLSGRSSDGGESKSGKDW